VFVSSLVPRVCCPDALLTAMRPAAGAASLVGWSSRRPALTQLLRLLVSLIQKRCGPHHDLWLPAIRYGPTQNELEVRSKFCILSPVRYLYLAGVHLLLLHMTERSR
jgi:hypothetical protein